MNKKYLVIFEVSQKQAYIFSSNKLRNNIRNSAVIAWVTSSDYYKEICANDDANYDEKNNLVYTGGGHTVLVFDTREQACEFVRLVTSKTYLRYPGLELFAAVHETAGEPGMQDLEQLSARLEGKKSIRRASFLHGTFGVEKLDVNTLNPVLCQINSEKYEEKIPEAEERIDKELMPTGYKIAFDFDKLCVCKNKGDFIAVVHIDGNAMGSRVIQMREELRSNSWEQNKDELRKFSECIDSDFKAAYKEMTEIVAQKLSGKDGIQMNEDKNSGEKFFPVRRIITAGDDICFVTDGSLGLECARIFLKCLSDKKNNVDNKKYAACAGVAIVHKNYPFYKAYELSEMLCSNAKKYIANVGNKIEKSDAAAKASAIDWHIEFGEIKEDISEIRKAYIATDQSHMEMRPYVVLADSDFMEGEKISDYDNFRKLEQFLQNEEVSYARGKLKSLRTAIKNGESETIRFLTENLIDELMLTGYQNIYKKIDAKLFFSGEGLERKACITTSDGIKRSMFFDSIECIDLFTLLED